jgi:amino-acid N-acetyltransferase
MYRNNHGEGHRRTVKVRPAATARPAARVLQAAIVPSRVVVRSAAASDTAAIHRLVADHAFEGRLLPRSPEEIAARIDRFVVATAGTRIIGCADLAPLSRSVAEVRSLVVASTARANGIGRKLLDQLTGRAAASGFDMLCAFTHSPAYFVHAGFSIVPHAWVPEKIDRDCRSCSLFRRCGQYAMALPLGAAIRHAGVSAVNG